MSENENGNMKILHQHKIASIAIKSNGVRGEEHFLLRKDMSPESLADLMEEFNNKLVSMRLKMLDDPAIPSSITDGFRSYADKIANKQVFEKRPVTEQTNIRKKYAFIRDLLDLLGYTILI